MSGAAVGFGEADLTTCDRELIHIPGSIQPHGSLLVFDRESLLIEQVAGDTMRFLGVEAHRLAGLRLSEALDSETVGQVSALLGAGGAFVAPAMRLGVGSVGGSTPLDMTLHAIDRTGIMELEPSRVVPAGAKDSIAQLKSLMAAVKFTAGVNACCAAAATTMREATGFDRAMVYRFLPDESGMVVAEDVRDGFESFLGLHYPASDIPKQARELYRRNWLRAIPDINYVPAPLFPATNRRTGQPIDMSHCDLRSVSPIHVEYLRNMGVCASLSASIICEDKLWGMLVLHHYSPRYVPMDVRVACETFAQILSLHVEAKDLAEMAVMRGRSRRLLDELAGMLDTASDIPGVLVAWDLLGYAGAAGAAVCSEGKLHLIGKTPSAPDILAIVQWLNGVNRPIFSTDHLCSVFPPATDFAALASGLLAVGVSRKPRDYVLWFRPEIGSTVRWAGDPTKPVKVDRHGARLTPRGSFAEWLEVKRMQSASWSDLDIEAAEALRVVLLEAILKNVELVQRERALASSRAMAEELERRVEERTSQLRALAADLEAAEERERREIARDLHDDLGQTLAAARIRLAGLCGDKRDNVRAPALEVDKLLARANSAIRSLAAQLTPDVLHELGLSAALDWLGEEIERTFALKVSVVDDGSPKTLAPETRSILYRAARELLINVAKHAQTDAAVVECTVVEGLVIVSVADSGVGYDAAKGLLGPVRGLGLIGMRERLSLIGGTFEVRSIPGKGTTIVISAPLQPPDPP